MSKEIKTPSIWGGILLVAGCCIGAGMLGLPVLSGETGFLPAMAMFFLSWFFMAVTGLLLLEVNLFFKEEVSLITMAEKTLGSFGKAVVWLLFLYLFYSLMVSYSAASGSLVTDFCVAVLGVVVPPWVGSLVFTVLFGVLIYCGTGVVDHFNRYLMAGLIVFYLLLLFVGLPHIHPGFLMRNHWQAAPLVIPAMVISFGFHNMVPTLKTYYSGRKRAMVSVVLLGSFVPLVIYQAWQGVILGIVPAEQLRQAVDGGEIATHALMAAVGSSWIAVIAEYFAFFSIVTSFLAVALSFVDFLADGFHKHETKGQRVTMCLLALAPPFVFSVLYPHIFLLALSAAGAYGAVILFGVLPALMVWKGRYVLGWEAKRLVPGGRAVLLVILLFSVGVVAMELAYDLGLAW